MPNDPLRFVRPDHIGSLKRLIPQLAIGLDVYIFGDAAAKSDYTSRIQLEVITEGRRFLHEMSEAEIQEGIRAAKEWHAWSENPADWNPREIIPVIPLLNRISEIYGNRSLQECTPRIQLQDGVLEAVVIRDGRLEDLTKGKLQYGGKLTYGKFAIRFHGVEFEAYALSNALPSSANMQRITTGDRIILPDDRYGSRPFVEKKK